MSLIRRKDPGQAWETEVDTGGGGGVSQPGAARVIGPFPFDYDTPGLVDGVEFYTPTVGDHILNIYAIVPTPWNGTTPKWDVFGSGADGIFKFNFGSNINNFDGDISFTNGSLLATNGLTLTGNIPIVVLADDPLKLVVSQNGLIGGADPGATQGHADFYLMISTPDAP